MINEVNIRGIDKKVVNVAAIAEKLTTIEAAYSRPSSSTAFAICRERG